MNIKELYEKLRESYTNSFDITEPYEIGGAKCLGYGYFHNNASQYVLHKKAKLWEADSYEHILFVESHDMSKDLDTAKKLISHDMEEQFVRRGKKYPAPNHMYSFVTVVLITDGNVSEDLVRDIENFKFKKNYLFQIRGYAEGRLIVVDLKNKEIYTNKKARELKDFYKKTINF